MKQLFANFIFFESKKFLKVLFYNKKLYFNLLYFIDDNPKYKSLSTKEINNLDYIIAIKIDKRTYLQNYCSLVKINQIFLFTFASNDDYNLFVLKLSLFLMSFSLYMVVDAFFLVWIKCMKFI